MKLSEYAIKFLGDFVAGDLPGLPYRSGPQFVKFFNHSAAATCTRPSRRFPHSTHLRAGQNRELDGTAALRTLVAKAVDPREFTNTEKTVEDAVALLNENLKYEGYELAREGTSPPCVT